MLSDASEVALGVPLGTVHRTPFGAGDLLADLKANAKTGGHCHADPKEKRDAPFIEPSPIQRPYDGNLAAC